MIKLLKYILTMFKTKKPARWNRENTGIKIPKLHIEEHITEMGISIWIIK